ncbi:MAG: hypothetical protein ICV55_16545 [Coleofasciculus sp. C3-bin4]|nr:hypothetical protein [Coleofasciculus sp. C3-bin4]
MVQQMRSLTEVDCVPQNIAWVESELWASLVDVLRTAAVRASIYRSPIHASS